MHFFPAAVLLVLANRDDDRFCRVVKVGGDLALEGPFEGALEMAQRFGPGLADARVAVAAGEDVLLAARLDARQSQLLAEDRGQFFEGQLDFLDVTTRLIAGAGLAIALGRSQGLTDIAVALAT